MNFRRGCYSRRPTPAVRASVLAARARRRSPSRPDCSSTVGGAVYPLVYSAPFLPDLHTGYSVVAVSMVPIVLLTAWVFRPKIAGVANEAGFVDGESESAAAGGSD